MELDEFIQEDGDWRWGLNAYLEAGYELSKDRKFWIRIVYGSRTVLATRGLNKDPYRRHSRTVVIAERHIDRGLGVLAFAPFSR